MQITLTLERSKIRKLELIPVKISSAYLSVGLSFAFAMHRARQLRSIRKGLYASIRRKRCPRCVELAKDDLS